MPKGRIAFSSDGNLHDTDDWGATAFSLALIHYAGLEKRFVHYDYNNHLGDSDKNWEQVMTDAAKGGAKRFGLDARKVFDDQSEKEAAITNFVKEANSSNKKNPLWFICAGPMQMAYDMIKATLPEKRKFIHAISHSQWNEVHNHSENKKTWEDMKKDFPDVVYHQILDQNKSNGEDDFYSHITNWKWLLESNNENWKWLYNIDDTGVLDLLTKGRKESIEKYFDISDAGMTYWLITGGPYGGNEKGGWKEVKALFENKPITNSTPTPEVVFESDDYIFLEAESTSSSLGNWNLIRKGNKNYVKSASGFAFLEFNGNKPQIGNPDSPLQYEFVCPKDGNYRMVLMTSKRLEGVPSDWCNDIFVKMEGDFESGTNLTKSDLTNYIKVLQEGNEATAELEWHWAVQAEKEKHKYYDVIYNFKKGQKYKLTLAGRSQRFSIDYILLYNSDKFGLYDAKDFFSKKK
ncbi:hypothetical protein [Flavobacterium pokkalii]|nr:hypothetical protein [Flavobacterium pokkalii]